MAPQQFKFLARLVMGLCKTYYLEAIVVLQRQPQNDVSM